MDRLEFGPLELEAVPLMQGDGASDAELLQQTAILAPIMALVPLWVEVDQAQRSKLVHAVGLLHPSEIQLVSATAARVAVVESPLQNNPENANIRCKTCYYLNSGGGSGRDGVDAMRRHAPAVLAKLLRFASKAWHAAGWGSAGGPLVGIEGVAECSVRVVEYWDYSLGGNLDVPKHFDSGSVVTIVTLLELECEGGQFSTLQTDGSRAVHPLAPGDAVAFVSHKYHSILPVVAGNSRKSLVIELWQPRKYGQL